MRTLFKRKSDCVVPFIVGLSLGLLISYAIRLLYKPGLCEPKNILNSAVPSTAVPTPDQIVNLAFSASHKKPEASDKSGKSNKSGLCSSDSESCGDNVIGSRDANKPRNLLFVGVMTASLFLDTRVKAVWETWAQDIPGKVVFFTGGNSFDSSQKLVNYSIPLVLLAGVDDSYPPQKKSFMMLKYMFENYGDDFEWFMRADDDVFIRGDKLSDFLRSIDSRHLHFIGQAGKGHQMRKGTLNLAHNQNYCMGGPGILMSRPTLKKVGPNVQACLQDMYSTHEDVEVGRCVKRFADISCTWAYEMQTIFHHNFSGELAFTKNLKRREVHKAITLHPIKDFKHLNRLHSYFKGLTIQELLHDKIMIQRDILSISQLVQNITKKSSDFQPDYLGMLNMTGLPPSLNKYLPSLPKDVILWDFIGKGVYSPGTTLNPKSKLKSDGREALEDVIREVMDLINGYSRTRGRVVEFKEILYGYRRVNPSFGVDYILDLFLNFKKFRGRKFSVPVRRHVYLQRQFSSLQVRLVTNHNNNGQLMSNDQKNIIMVVPLAGRYETFQRFLDNFIFTCLDLFSEKIRASFQLSLVVVFFGSDEEKEKYLRLVQKTRDSLSRGAGTEHWCKIRMVQIESEFSRGIALETGISQCHDEDLLFLIDVDLTFTADVVRRVNLNTKKGQQAYFPIVFSQYNPKFYGLKNDSFSVFSSNILSNNFGTCKTGEKCNLSSDFGYWREFGFGIACFYKSDFRKAGGFDTSIKGWGKEDVALFDSFLLHTNLTIFRAPDPHLLHVFHETECDLNLPKSQLDMCLGSQAETLGSYKNLLKYLVQHNKLEPLKG